MAAYLDEEAEVDEAMVAEKAFERAALYVAAAVAFGIGVWFFLGATAGSEYFAGYLLEQSLSVDNLFVFVLVFRYFKTPVDAQRKALFWGILTAAVLRGIMIGLGVELIQLFEPLLLIFAAILLFSSYKLLTAGGDDDGDDDLSDNTVVKLCRRFIPVGAQYDGDKFVTNGLDGKRVLTPLVLVLAVIEISDVIFAVDSIPAVFGITLDPFIVYSSNLFAIISLRAFYSFVAVFIEKLRYLDKAVSLVLGFIGAKMIADYFGLHMPTWAALVVVAGTLSAGVGASLMFPAPEDSEEGDDRAEGADLEAGSDKDSEELADIPASPASSRNNGGGSGVQMKDMGGSAAGAASSSERAGLLRRQLSRNSSSGGLAAAVAASPEQLLTGRGSSDSSDEASTPGKAKP